MKKIIFILTTIGFLTNCADNQPTDIRSPDLKKVATSDSGSFYLTDTTIYNFMTLILDSIISDSNLLELKATPIEIDNCGFTFTEMKKSAIKDEKGNELKFNVGGKNFIGSKSDSIDILHQLTQNKDKHWRADKLKQFPLDPNYLNMYRTKEKGFDWDKFRKDGNGCIVSFSIPIFDKARTKAMIKVSRTCGGLSGYGSTYRFEKKKNGWTVAEEAMDWIS